MLKALPNGGDVAILVGSLTATNVIQRTQGFMQAIKGSKIKVELNGTVILDADVSKVTEYMANSPHPGKDRTSGFFGFAGHGDPVAFKNVAVKTLD